MPAWSQHLRLLPIALLGYPHPATAGAVAAASSHAATPSPPFFLSAVFGHGLHDGLEPMDREATAAVERRGPRTLPAALRLRVDPQHLIRFPRVRLRREEIHLATQIGAQAAR